MSWGHLQKPFACHLTSSGLVVVAGYYISSIALLVFILGMVTTLKSSWNRMKTFDLCCKKIISVIWCWSARMESWLTLTKKSSQFFALRLCKKSKNLELSKWKSSAVNQYKLWWKVFIVQLTLLIPLSLSAQVSSLKSILWQ